MDRKTKPLIMPIHQAGKGFGAKYFRWAGIFICVLWQFSMSANAVSLKNCGQQVNYGKESADKRFRPIAVHGLAFYEILAMLNIHDRAVAISGINRSSVQFQAWNAARAARKAISRYHLPENVLRHLIKLPGLAVRYPTVRDLQNRKAKLFFGGYYQGFDPKNANNLRRELHEKKIFTFISQMSCRNHRDRIYQSKLSDIFADISAIARITGQSHIAQERITQDKERLARVHQKIAGKRLRRVFYYAGGLNTPYGPDRSSMAAAILREAGAEIIGMTDRGNARLGWSDLRRANLDAIIIPFDGDGDRLRYRRRIIEEKLGGASVLSRIIVVYDGDWQASPAAVFAVENLAVELYPEAFPRDFLNR